MKVSGFTIIRNARLMGYPIIQSVSSILDIVDEFVIEVGQSDDDTVELIKLVGRRRACMETQVGLHQ